MKRAQTISFDAVIAVALFIVAAILLFFVTGKQSDDEKARSIEKESAALAELLSAEQNTTISIISGQRVDISRLAAVSNISYTVLKEHTGIRSDFCIYFEDEKGNVVPVPLGKLGVGSPDAVLSGVACNEAPP